MSRFFLSSRLVMSLNVEHVLPLRVDFCPQRGSCPFSVLKLINKQE